LGKGMKNNSRVGQYRSAVRLGNSRKVFKEIRWLYI
jgi:hypothetical protein